MIYILTVFFFVLVFLVEAWFAFHTSVDDISPVSL